MAPNTTLPKQGLVCRVQGLGCRGSLIQLFVNVLKREITGLLHRAYRGSRHTYLVPMTLQAVVSRSFPGKGLGGVVKLPSSI